MTRVWDARNEAARLLIDKGGTAITCREIAKHRFALKHLEYDREILALEERTLRKGAYHIKNYLRDVHQIYVVGVNQTFFDEFYGKGTLPTMVEDVHRCVGGRGGTYGFYIARSVNDFIWFTHHLRSTMRVSKGTGEAYIGHLQQALLDGKITREYVVNYALDNSDRSLLEVVSDVNLPHAIEGR
jgi:hypothetical protein